MRRKECGSCGHPDVDVFLNLGATPLGDSFPATQDEVETVYPLELGVCFSCRLVQLMEVVDDKILYGHDYGFFMGANKSQKEYWASYAWTVMHQFDLQGPGLGVVEIASNDGTLLEHFHEAGIDVLGVDPASGPATVAESKGIPVRVEGFSYKVAADILSAKGPAKCIIANNVVAHVSDLNDFLSGMSILLDSDGVAIIEVQYLGDLLTGNMFDHVYHEHRFFYSARSLTRALLRHDLHVTAIYPTDAQGGSIRVYARKNRLHKIPPANTLFQTESWLEEWCSYDGFQGRVNRIRDRLQGILAQQSQLQRRVAGYAATAKSTTLLNFCGITNQQLSYVEDTTPYKRGRFTPGTKIPIVAPGDRPEPDTYLLLGWNYLAPVLRRHTAFTDRGGQWIVPIPLPVLL